MQHVIRVGPEFFAKAKNEYSSWIFAIAREFIQNSIDAKSKNINVTIAPNEDHTLTVIVANDGETMTQDILCNKLLCLGGSGKDFNDDSVGGFGQAKHVLYMLHNSYTIETGNLRVDGQGGGYDLTEVEVPYQGTRSTIVVQGDHYERFVYNFKRCITLSNWSGTFTINSNTIEERVKTGIRKKDLSFAHVYAKKKTKDGDHVNEMIVRIGGIVMFTRYIPYDGIVVLELIGKSCDVLQSSRDGLKYELQCELDDFVVSLSVNKHSALKNNAIQTERSRYAGYLIKGGIAPVKGLAEAMGKIMDKSEAKRLAMRFINGDIKEDEVPVVQGGGQNYSIATAQGQIVASMTAMVNEMTDVKDRKVESVPLRPDFVLKNESGLKVPDWMRPDSFSTYAKTLVWRWMSCLVTMADITNYDEPFSIGFIIDETCEGEYEKVGGDRTIYINPVTINRPTGKSASLQCKWKMSGIAIWDMVSVAAHEWVHHMGYISHDETYARKLTDLLASCLKERTRFAKVFQQPVKWPE